MTIDGTGKRVAEAADFQGTTTTAARRWLRRSVALLAAPPVMAAFLQVPAAQPAHAGTPAQAARTAPAARTAVQAALPPVQAAQSVQAAQEAPASQLAQPPQSAQSAAQAAQPAQTVRTTQNAGTAQATATGSDTALVSIHRVTPTVPQPDDTLTLTGMVTNRGKSTITDADVALRLGPSLTSRSAIDQAVQRTRFAQHADGAEIDSEHAVGITDLAPGASRKYTLKVPVSDLNLGDRPGARQLGVSLTGKTTGGPYSQVLGIDRTVLPWQPSAARNKTELTFLWPLVSDSHLAARTDSDEQQTPVFHDDDLLAELSPGGRLQQMVALGKDLPVTWVIDPDLLATADAMTKRYQVRTEDGGTVPGKGQQYAKKWLLDLQEAVRDAEVVALPFADPDLASLAHRGKNVAGALSHLRPATELSEKTVEIVLGTVPSTDFAWPVEGAVDPSIVSVATSAGAHNVIARSDSLSDNHGLPYTPTAARPIGGGTTAVVADSRLSQRFESDLTTAGASSRAVQRFLAETQSISAQVPNKQRSIVVAPQRQPTTSQAQAMAAAVAALRDTDSWTQFTDLTQAAAADPDPLANEEVPSAGAYPKSLREQELPTSAFEQMGETQKTLDGFRVILSREDRVVVPFGNAIQREMSTSWRRSSAEEATSFRESVHNYLESLTRKVRLIQKSPMTLSGRSATIPVTVQNNLVQPVEGLVLKLESSRRIGLDVGDPQPVQVSGGHSQSVKFTTSAKANGRTYLEAQLYTSDGKPYGAPMRFQANVTEITSAVLLVIAGGVLLLVLAGVRMYTQRKRGGARPDPEAPLAPPPTAEPQPATSADQPDEADRPDQSHEADRPEHPGRPGRSDQSGRPDRPSDPAADTRPGSGDRAAPGEKVDR